MTKYDFMGYYLLIRKQHLVVLRICNAVHTLFLPEYIPVICLVSFDFLVKSVSAFDKYQREGFQYYSEQLLKLRL